MRKIIDFHTHPFLNQDNNICRYADACDMSVENTKRHLSCLGIEKICGSVILPADRRAVTWNTIRSLNDTALRLKQLYGDFYVPGFTVHPDYITESCKEIERMYKLGVKLIGELVPYMHGWQDYSSKAFSEILDVAQHYGMIVSFHSTGDDSEAKMVARHSNILFVGAHPGEYDVYSKHLDMLSKCDNYLLDLSGVGLFRHGMLRAGIDRCGAERFLYGSDYPTCNPAMFVGGIVNDFTLTEKEKDLILYHNAARILGL